MSAPALERHVRTALELGINLFDHADIYGGGACETQFGQLLKAAPSLRQSMLLQSKCGIRPGLGYDLSKQHILASVDASLKRLNTEYLDLLLLHRPDALMEPEEIGEAFNALVQSGKVRQFGVSNFNAAQMQLLQSGLTQPLHINQLQFSLAHCGMIRQGISANTSFEDALDRDGGVLDHCRANKVTIQCWSPLQFGMFGGNFIDHPDFAPLNAVLDRLAGEYSTSKAAIAVSWILRHPANMQVIAGTANPDHLAELCAAAHIELTRSQWYELYCAAGNQLP